jgi:glycerol-3-phosphate dehydrogenase (NAD(P)+)
VVASNDIEIAEKIAQVFRSSVFRIYTSQDILGVELAGALKNVLAIAGGISDGLGFGQNTKGVLVARGLHEITRLGIAMGARIDTFMGVAGVGDLFTTAQSDLSRNYRVGVALGKGQKLEEILKELGQVAEGVPTSKIALRIARAYNVCLPITEMTAAILAGQVKPHKAVTLLMERKAKQEGYVETDYSWEKPLHA